MSLKELDSKDYEFIMDEFESVDQIFKIAILGYEFVGKTWLVQNALENKFTTNYKPTVGYDISNLKIKFKDTKMKFIIWDITGNENIRNMAKLSLQKTNLAILVYSIDNKKSFEYIDKVYKELKSQSDSCKDIILVGNKADLDEKREVTYEEGQKKCENETDFKQFLECSAKEGTNTKEIFIQAANLLYKESVNEHGAKNIGEEKISLNSDNKEDLDYDDEEEDNNNIKNDEDLNKSHNEEEKSKKAKKKCCCCHLI